MCANSSTQFKIQQLRTDKILYMVEAIAVLAFCHFLYLYLGTILMGYVFPYFKITEAPNSLQYLPLVIFIFGVGYFFFAVIGNFLRYGKIRKLEAELEKEPHHHHGDEACCSNCMGECECKGHGNCACGCGMNETASAAETEKEKVVEPEVVKGSVNMLAERMKTANKKKKTKK